jgi:hypothetical protein
MFTMATNTARQSGIKIKNQHPPMDKKIVETIFGCNNTAEVRQHCSLNIENFTRVKFYAVKNIKQQEYLKNVHHGEPNNLITQCFVRLQNIGLSKHT